MPWARRASGVAEAVALVDPGAWRWSVESGAVGICCEAVAEGMGEARGPREAREVGACIYIAPEYALSGLYLYTYRYCTPDTTAIYVGTVHRRPASTRDSRIAVTTPARGFRTYDRALHATTAQGRPPRRLAPVSRSQLAGESPVAFPGESPVAFSGESPVAFPALSSASAVPPPSRQLPSSCDARRPVAASTQSSTARCALSI